MVESGKYFFLPLQNCCLTVFFARGETFPFHAKSDTIHSQDKIAPKHHGYHPNLLVNSSLLVQRRMFCTILIVLS